MIFPYNRQSSKSFTKALNENTLMREKSTVGTLNIL